MPPPGLVAERGTAVRLTVDNALSPLLDPGFVETALRRHFHPLFDPTFTEILRDHYPSGVAFMVNGARLDTEGRVAAETAQIGVKLARRRKPSAAGYMIRDRTPLPEERRGLAISTLGKVIKRGWDWLGITPADPERVGGLIEVPALAECLTLNKIDFIRAGARGATYLAYRKAIQEAVARQLTEWGDAAESGERERRRAARPVERDLEAVLMDLADDFPLLASLVEQRAGGQRRLPMAGSGKGVGDLASGAELVAASVLGVEATAASEVREPSVGGGTRGEGGAPTPPALPGAEPTTAVARLPEAAARSGGPDATASPSSSRGAPTTRSSRASSSRRCGSTRRIPPIGAPPPRVPRGTTSRSLPRSPSPRSPSSRRRSTPS